MRRRMRKTNRGVHKQLDLKAKKIVMQKIKNPNGAPYHIESPDAKILTWNMFLAVESGSLCFCDFPLCAKKSTLLGHRWGQDRSHSKSGVTAIFLWRSWRHGHHNSFSKRTLWNGQETPNFRLFMTTTISEVVWKSTRRFLILIEKPDAQCTKFEPMDGQLQ